MRPTANTRSPAGKWNGVHSESATPEPPDNRNSAADNGAESQNIKADGLSLSSLSDDTDLWRDQLTRIETILDCILRSLAPLAGAR